MMDGCAPSSLHSCRLRQAVDHVVAEDAKVGGAQPGDGVPALDGGEALAARGTALLGALVVAGGDVVEGRGLLSPDLVQRGIQESERLLAGGDAGVVEQGHDAGHGRGAGRGAAHLAPAAGLVDEERVADGSHIRVAARGLVEVAGRRQVGAGGQELGHGLVLVRGARRHVAEAAARGEAGHLVGHGHLLAARDALVLRAHLVREAADLGVLHLGGAHGGQVRRGSRVGGLEGGAGAEGVGAAVGAAVAGAGQDGDTTETDLLPLGVHAGHVAVRVHAQLRAVVLVDLALVRLAPAEGHGDDGRHALGVHELDTEVIQPVGGGPVPVVRAHAHSRQVLNVQHRLRVRRRVEGAHLVRDRLRLGARLLVEGGHVAVLVRAVVLELDHTLRRAVAGRLVVADVVQAADATRHDHAAARVRRGAVQAQMRHREVAHARHQLDGGQQVRGDGPLAHLLHGARAARRLHEHVEVGLEQRRRRRRRQAAHRHRVAQVLDRRERHSLLEQPLDHRVHGVRVADQAVDLLHRHVTSEVGRVRVGHIPESALQHVQVALVQRDSEIHLVLRRCRTLRRPGARNDLAVVHNGAVTTDDKLSRRGACQGEQEKSGAHRKL
mmetsp:Transcript_22894/g.73716  ORF Transcript_22894/g.73716 Transcript_22894/m.73716 type:complete len:609 (+) Transcript_22894:197-2023(+)